jgi:hypothetical protein
MYCAGSNLTVSLCDFLSRLFGRPESRVKFLYSLISVLVFSLSQFHIMVSRYSSLPRICIENFVSCLICVSGSLLTPVTPCENHKNLTRTAWTFNFFTWEFRQVQGPKCLRALYSVGWSGTLSGRNLIPGRLENIYFYQHIHTGCRTYPKFYPLGNGELLLEIIRLEHLPSHVYSEV